MFFNSISAGLRAGKVRIGLPAVGGGNRVTILATGLLGWKARFLSASERQQLAFLSLWPESVAWPESTSVDDWTPAQRDLVRNSITTIGMSSGSSKTNNPVVWDVLTGDTQQRRLLDWDSAQAAQVIEQVGLAEYLKSR